MILMESLPRGRPATKDDVDDVGARLDAVDRRLNERIDHVRHDMAAMEERLNERIDLRTQSMADQVRSEMHIGFGQLRTDMAAQTRMYMFTMVGALASIAAVAFAAP